MATNATIIREKQLMHMRQYGALLVRLQYSSHNGTSAQDKNQLMDSIKQSQKSILYNFSKCPSFPIKLFATRKAGQLVPCMVCLSAVAFLLARSNLKMRYSCRSILCATINEAIPSTVLSVVYALVQSLLTVGYVKAYNPESSNPMLFLTEDFEHKFLHKKPIIKKEIIKPITVEAINKKSFELLSTQEVLRFYMLINPPEKPPKRSRT